MSVARPLHLPDLEVFREPGRHNPTVLRRVLGALLRQRREAAGMEAQRAAGILQCSPATISRLETQGLGLTERKVAALLSAYGESESDIAACVLLVRDADRPGWWQRYDDVLPKWLDALIALQDACSVIRTYEVQLVPGLLQTKEYATCVTRGRPYLTPEQVERLVRLRMERQDLLWRSDAPNLWVLLHEWVLETPGGGPRVMREQLEHLIKMAEQPHITLQLTQVRDQYGPVVANPITYLRFDQLSLPDTVYLEDLEDARFLDRRSECDRYRSMLDTLLNYAASPEDTVRLLKAKARSLQARSL
ncbi:MULTISPECIES: helix-turn-helix transcriptional regulator [unclassified Streptomyces]|uniref:helix-turn-helix domain-containing protein n=1 Tax=unclassified Streptomyces TaxID=2593676 RepID=UPI00278C17D9|nr:MULTISPECIES: helix-turn-helix transcriptional regulator [unclassified Streptomyces]